MAVINALAGKVTSWSGYSALLSTLMKPAAINLDMQGGASDSTGFGSSGVIVGSKLAQMRSYLARISGWFPNSPANGTTALVTYASGFVTHAHAFTLEITWGAEQYAVFNGSGVDDWSYSPMLANWRGTWTSYLDGSTNFSDIHGATDAPAAATFKLLENTADDTLAGTIIVTGGPVSVPLASGLPTVQYSFEGSGQLTAAGTVLAATGTGIFDDSAHTLVTPTPGSLIWQTAASRTVTASAFPTRVAFGVSMNGTTTLQVDARVSGGLTIA